jgi:hypothetical protein
VTTTRITKTKQKQQKASKSTGTKKQTDKKKHTYTLSWQEAPNSVGGVKNQIY